MTATNIASLIRTVYCHGGSTQATDAKDSTTFRWFGITTDGLYATSVEVCDCPFS